MNKNKYIVKTFNKVFNSLIIATAIFTIFLILFLRKQTISFIRTFLIIFYLLGFIFFWVYKYWLSKDEEYHKINNPGKPFNWLGELPFHPCNVILLMAPIALITMNDGLLGFCFYYSLFAPVLGLLMPCDGFAGYSILLKRNIGYYGTHLIILIIAPLFFSLKLFIPNYHLANVSFSYIIVVNFIAFLINVFLRKTKLYEDANYFYNYVPLNNKIIEFFYKLIPHHFLYTLPMLVILYGYTHLITFIFKLLFKC